MRLIRVSLRLTVVLGVLAVASPASASPISAHSMVHSCCMASEMKERIFSEAKALGAGYIRVDVELNGIFATPDAEPDWDGLDELIELSEKHRLRVLGIVLAPPAGADEEDFGRLAGEVAEYAAGRIDHWEIVNEPDGEWAFDGPPEQYALMLSAAYDEIKARVPDAKVLLGGLMRPHEPAWLERVFATPGADALHKFDIANAHLRGPVDAVVHRYGELKARLAGLGFTGPLWVTEHGYPADPAFQVDRAYFGGDSAQAAYLTQSLVGLGELGAEQVFVTLRDNLEGEYATEGLVHIDEAQGHTSMRREAFGAVHRLAAEWDLVMAWRREQREHEQQLRAHQATASIYAGEARTSRAKFHQARLAVHAAQDDLARRGRPAVVLKRLARRLARARALAAGRRMALLWDRAITRYYRERAYEQAAAVHDLKQRIAGAG
jgi:hypothetical protein